MVLLAIPTVLLVGVTVTAFFGRWSWWLDVLANFRPQYVAALTLAALFLLLGHWRKTALVAVAGIVANLAVIVPLYVGMGRVETATPTLRVMSFNLYDSNLQFGEVIALIDEVGADVVFLHEVSRPWELALDAAVPDYRITRSRSEELIFGTLVLSRPEDSVTSFGFTIGGPRAVEVIHDGVAILGIHPISPTTAERAALRNAQIGFAADWANDQDRPHLVTGDFNATPWSYPFRRLLATTDLRNSQRGFGIQPTFPADGFFAWRVPIDHLLHSPDLVVVDRRLGRPAGSDHFPLIVDLTTAP